MGGAVMSRGDAGAIGGGGALWRASVLSTGPCTSLCTLWYAPLVRVSRWMVCRRSDAKMGARLTGCWMPLDKHALLRFAKGNRERERGSFDCVPAGRVRELLLCERLHL